MNAWFVLCNCLFMDDLFFSSAYKCINISKDPCKNKLMQDYIIILFLSKCIFLVEYKFIFVKAWFITFKNYFLTSSI